MDLKNLIAKANVTYNLGLDADGSAELHSRLRVAGYRSEVVAEKIGHTIDTILSMSDQLRVGRDTPRSVYASLKQEVVADSGDQCPRCKGNMRDVKLVGARDAKYCLSCSITLPIKVE